MTDLQTQLATLLGWKPYSYVSGTPPTQWTGWKHPNGSLSKELPSLSELVAIAEGRLTEEQQEKYVSKILYALVGERWEQRTFKLITASADIRARAIIEVLK